MFIVLGDIIDKGNIEGYVSAEKYFSSLRHELKDYKIKFEFIPGNHDLVNGSLSDFDTFISIFCQLDSSGEIIQLLQKSTVM